MNAFNSAGQSCMIGTFLCRTTNGADGVAKKLARDYNPMRSCTLA
jgi:hypothetical protein